MSINGINDKVFVEHKINSLWTFNENLSEFWWINKVKLKKLFWWTKWQLRYEIIIMKQLLKLRQ